MKNKSVLILVYSLALSQGVGARRWYKYAEELANRGCKVFIVGADNNENDYINHSNIVYKTFKSKYPKVLESAPYSTIKKIEYHLALYRQKRKVKGAIYDKASLDKNIIISTVKGMLLKYNISNLIVTGAPFSMLYYGSLIKKDIPSIKYIGDIRDKWTWGDGYGISNLQGAKKKYENFMEYELVNTADKIMVASDDLKLFLENKYPLHKEKFKVLLNGIEFRETRLFKKKISAKKIVITHIGTVNIDTEKYWQPFLTLIKNYENILVQFIGGNNTLVNNYVKLHDINNVKFIGRVRENELKPFFEVSDYALLFKKDGFENTFPTKFFDYLKYRIKIIAFTRQGGVKKEIETYSLGKVFDENIKEEEFLDFVNSNRCKEYKKDYDVDKFSIASLSSIILEELI